MENLLEKENKQLEFFYHQAEELYDINADQEKLVQRMTFLFVSFVKMKDLNHKKELEEKIYDLYAGICDEVLSFSSKDILKAVVKELGLLSLEEYYKKDSDQQEKQKIDKKAKKLIQGRLSNPLILENQINLDEENKMMDLLYKREEKLYDIYADQKILVKRMVTLFVYFSKMHDLEHKKKLEEKIYSLYAGICDEVLSFLYQDILKAVVKELGLLSLEEYYKKDSDQQEKQQILEKAKVLIKSVESNNE